MTATLVQIPLAIGASAAQMAGRACVWGAEHFMRSPIASTGLIFASGLMLMAGTNALFLQDGRHPAPLFAAGASSTSTPVPAPIAPVVVEPETVPLRPTPTAAAPSAEPTQSQSSVPAAQAIGNQDIADMQAKLQAMGLFDGTVDGYYGPKTADAIRAFEARFNLPRTGAATPQVIQAVRDAPVSGAEAPRPAPSPAPQPVATIAAAQPVPAPAAADDATILLAQMQGEADARPVTADEAPAVAAEPAATQVASTAAPPALDGDLVSDIQRGLSRLGFLQGPINGVADEATARAIRKFQIFNNFSPTGEVSPIVRDMLVAAGAYI